MIIEFTDLQCPYCGRFARDTWPLLREYQKHRICTLLDPSKDPLGKGFHIIQGQIAIGSGGLTGKGLMQGTQTHLEFIPEKHTDFIFPVVAEEWGFLGSAVVLGLFGPYHKYHGFCTHDPPVPGPAVIMHCSNDVKAQVVLLSPLLPPYWTHHGR